MSKLRAEVNARLQTHAVQRDRRAFQGRQKDSDMNAAVVGALEWVITLLDDPETYPHIDPDQRGDRDFIQRHWRAGVLAARGDRRDQADGWSSTDCPYEVSSVTGTWWTRGYQFEKANAGGEA
jgi:hypothetical protein